jgi:hypothetical protein
MRRRITLTLLLLAAALAHVACGDHGHTDELVAAGKAASTHLTAYYDDLGKTTIDWWEYQTAYNTLQEIPPTQELEHLMTERVAALHNRALMASRLTDVYDSIGRLRSPTSTQPTVTAAQNLGKAMSGVPKLPGADLSSGLGQAADLLMGLKRDRDSAAATKALTDAVTNIRDLFAHEQATYAAVIRDRDQTRQALLASLVHKKLVNTSPLLERLHLGVTWTTTDPDASTALALNIQANNAQRIESSWSCATDDTATMLTRLVSAHEQLNAKTIPAPAALERATARASTCLTQGEQE